MDMAFVNLGASSLLPTAKVGKTTAACPLSSRRAPAVHARARNAPRMAFSSIDTPEEAIVLSESDFETKQAVLNAAYKHVFGNAYLMEEERAELAVAESDFLYKGTSTRELIRAMGKSNAYQKRFFAKSSPYRFVELNCKHFLGRGPRDQDEISFHVQKLINEGFEAEIDTYFDSGEYETRFGELGVPRFIYEGAYPKNDDFSRMNVMRMYWDGCSTSTKYGSTAPGRPMDADLLGGRGSYVNGFVKISKGLRAGFRPEPQTRTPFQGVPSNPRAPLKTRIKVAENLYQVIEIPGVTDPAENEPDWKKDIMAANPGRKLNGVFF